jgi:3-methyladenine DNA glycosylase AlkD
MMNLNLIKIEKEIQNSLFLMSDDKFREGSQRYFKEEVMVIGVKAAKVKKIAEIFRNETKSLLKNDLFQLCELLWLSGYLEESFIACHLSFKIAKSYTTDDFQVFERWVKSYINNWASCDKLCNHNVGTLLEMYEVLIPNLESWAKSENRWMRRASAVSLILPARKGKFFSEIIKLANILMTDKDDLVQKGYGWMLKSASRLHQSEIFDYVMKNKHIMPRTALRYSIENLPEALKKMAMER